ncbi:MAG: DUF2089 domain-containing protein, partial [Oscillospiraceae bacterium]|nr:DUF2089 domain-containing protein [Oscillospiraceae bacterium]
MAKRAIGICPACGERTAVTRIACDGCDTVIEGRFSLCEFCGLSLAQKEFLLAFLRSRGSIKDVEKSLGVSYPTVKNRLEDLLAALGLADRGGDARVGEP